MCRIHERLTSTLQTSGTRNTVFILLRRWHCKWSRTYALTQISVIICPGLQWSLQQDHHHISLYHPGQDSYNSHYGSNYCDNRGARITGSIRALNWSTAFSLQYANMPNIAIINLSWFHACAVAVFSALRLLSKWPMKYWWTQYLWRRGQGWTEATQWLSQCQAAVITSSWLTLVDVASNAASAAWHIMLQAYIQMLGHGILYYFLLLLNLLFN